MFTLSRGAISCKSSKKTCIARFAMESKLVALEKEGIEDEWLKNPLVNLFVFIC